MATIFNQKDLRFTARESPIKEFLWHTSPRLSELANSEHLQFDVRSLDPDKFSYPYHFHRNAEELFVILSGSSTLRTPEGFSKLSAGDIVFFEMVPTGAHQLYNHTDSPCIFLDIRTTMGVDICEYPDSDKINILPYKEIYQKGKAVDYYLNEDKIREKWPSDIMNGGPNEKV